MKFESTLKTISFVLLLFAASSSYSQDSLVFKVTKKIQFTKSDTIYFDSVPVLQEYILVTDSNKNIIPASQYYISSEQAYIVRLNSSISNVIVSYQPMNANIFNVKRNKDLAIKLHYNAPFTNPFAYTPAFNKNKDIIDKDGLDMKGSISRGLGFGNSQNLVVNSNLNLQINGKLNDDIDITAAVSDDNNPIQPEGNTQQLQDFDRVYIKLSKNKTAVTLGDFEMLKPKDNYFMKYYKKSRGIQFSTQYKQGKNWNLYTSAEGAISRGRFARNVIQVIEGNQGPYRLSGTNNEQFIIIISGTEAIYIDGEKLERGEQNDYTIDYNTGELIFMPKRLITRYSRVIAEFQYADRNYARSVFTLSQSAEWKNKVILKANYFTEEDHKNQPFQRVLSDSDIYLLNAIGNDLDKAIINTETTVPVFDKSKLLYTKKDTTVNGTTYSIYMFTPVEGTDTNYYSVTFNNVGVGNGNYNIAKNGANGRVFEWVAPVNGKLSGGYEPILKLISPKRLQMATLGTTIKMDSLSQLSIDLVTTNYNKNLFSDLDKQNDIGWGVKGLYKRDFNLKTKKNKLKTAYQLSYEQVDKNFKFIERYRSVEFDRIWNRSLQNTDRKDTGYAEKIGVANLYIIKKDWLKVNYQTSFYIREQIFSGLQNKADGMVRMKHTVLDGNIERINTTAYKG
ncbi:MAG: hypothetical protein HYZ42_12770 [Bacteroidetes bacterium]|nr:hypothetical protein [Bacteroidota bacterium]